MNDTKPSGEKKVGPIVATLIIVLVLIIAALYLFASKANQPAIPTDASMQAANASTSIELNSLQKELDNSTAGLDKQNF